MKTDRKSIIKRKRGKEKMRRGQKDNICIRGLLIWLVCFMLGIGITRLCKGEIVEKQGFLDEYTLLCISHTKIDYFKYLLYLLEKRIGGIIVLALVSSTYLGFICIYAHIGWLGVAAGIFLTGAGIRYGTKGILLFLGGMLPHQLILVPCGILFMCWCYSMCAALYAPGRCRELVYGNKRQFVMRKLLQFLFFAGVVIVGCLAECYVNPYIYTKILKLF